MGNAAASPRLQRLIDLGFDEAECRYALAAVDGDVDRAAAILLERRRKHGIARIVNDMLRDQRPWDEFFARFMWPGHWYERVHTNVLYYRANYVVLCTFLVVA